MKKIVLLALGLVAMTTTHAQDKIETTVSGDIEVVISGVVWMQEVRLFSQLSVSGTKD